MYLKIPNEEIKAIFADTIASWFTDEVSRMDRRPLFDVLWTGNDQEATGFITDILFDTISYFDYREDYYHAFLGGLFTGAGYAVESNREYGLGRPDLVIRDKKNRRMIMMEIKYSKSEARMSHDCDIAMRQIKRRRYDHQFLRGYQLVFCYGITFFKKQCLLKKIDEIIQ